MKIKAKPKSKKHISFQHFLLFLPFLSHTVYPTPLLPYNLSGNKWRESCERAGPWDYTQEGGSSREVWGLLAFASLLFAGALYIYIYQTVIEKV